MKASGLQERLLREIGDERLARDDIVFTYAQAIRLAAYPTPPPIDWSLVHLAINLRWSTSAVEYVKDRAWKMARGELG